MARFPRRKSSCRVCIKIPSSKSTFSRTNLRRFQRICARETRRLRICSNDTICSCCSRRIYALMIASTTNNSRNLCNSARKSRNSQISFDNKRKKYAIWEINSQNRKNAISNSSILFYNRKPRLWTRRKKRNSKTLFAENQQKQSNGSRVSLTYNQPKNAKSTDLWNRWEMKSRIHLPHLDSRMNTINSRNNQLNWLLKTNSWSDWTSKRRTRFEC